LFFWSNFIDNWVFLDCQDYENNAIGMTYPTGNKDQRKGSAVFKDCLLFFLPLEFKRLKAIINSKTEKGMMIDDEISPDQKVVPRLWTKKLKRFPQAKS